MFLFITFKSNIKVRITINKIRKKEASINKGRFRKPIFERFWQVRIMHGTIDNQIVKKPNEIHTIQLLIQQQYLNHKDTERHLRFYSNRRRQET